MRVALVLAALAVAGTCGTRAGALVRAYGPVRR
jgi:hypothetical protein